MTYPMCLASIAIATALLASASFSGAAFAQEAVEVEIAGPEGALAGTLVQLEAEDAEYVLIIPGSGATDRDGNGPLGLATDMYLMLADGMAGAGIGSLRIDKRGLFGSIDAISDPNDVTLGDYAQDMASWVDEIQARTGVECVWLLGHSEGGLIALVTAMQEDADLCGLLLVATPGRPAGQVMAEQLQANPANAPILDEALAVIAQLEQGERVDEISPFLAQLFDPSVQGFLVDLFTTDPAAVIAQVELPVLILQGVEDIQVGIEDAERLAQANPDARLVVLDGVNHVLKPVPAGDMAANLATYMDPTIPLDDAVVEAITDFIVRSRD